MFVRLSNMVSPYSNSSVIRFKGRVARIRNKGNRNLKIIEKRNCKASEEWKRQWQRWKGKEENDLIITNRVSYIHLLVLWFTEDRLTTPRVSVVKEEKKENHLTPSIHHRPRIIPNRGRNKTTLYTDTRVYTTITRFLGFLKRVRQRWSSFLIDNMQKRKTRWLN